MSKTNIEIAAQWVPIGELTPWAENPRKNEAAVSHVAKSIERFGFSSPIIARKGGDVIAGHTRLLAAQRLGLDKVPVRYMDLDPVDAKLLALADNKVGEIADWDDEALDRILSELKADGVDLDGLGWSDDELAEILNEEVEGLTDEDQVPEPPEQPVTVDGDLWILGDHRLLCGDSTKLEVVERLMDGQKADICFTSPPYNAGSLNIKGNKTTDKKYQLYDDNKTSDDYRSFIRDNLNAVLAHSYECFYNIGLVQNNKRVIFEIINEFGDSFKDIIYWRKTSVAPHIQPGVINNLVEFIICFGDGKRKFINPQFSQGSYWNVIEGPNAGGNQYSHQHKATFPVYLPENIIENFCPKGGRVMDSFGGSGTTLIASEKLMRKAYLIEIDPIYCDLIINRWQDFTGSKATLESTGQTYDEMKGERLASD